MTYNPNENYCTLSPDTVFGVKINYACYLHDRQYRNEVKVRKTRLEVDTDFRNGIKDIMTRAGKPKRAWFTSWIYYYGCRVLGLFTWKN